MSNPMVLLETSHGEILIELFSEQAPKSVENFLRYVDEGFYDATVFHRVINGFMIQGGGLDMDMAEKPTHAPVTNEAANGLKNEAGTIAMARTMDPHSATAQFFINVSDNDFLDHRDTSPQGFGYAVFGKVSEGMETVNKIKKVRTRTVGFHENVPFELVTINKASRFDG
ncbi:MAG: peptidylprolyl isomerase [Desulfovibrionaceae bacterium]